MAQHDMNIANQGFPATRADINNALQALVSNSSGTSAPSTTFANQWWYDTTNNKLYIRNEANNAWIQVAVLDQTNNEWQITTGQISAADGDGLVFKTDDGNTRITLSDGGDVTFADGTDVITASAGTDNVRIGQGAGDSIASGGNNNVVIGKDAGTAITTGDRNTAIGKDALKSVTTGSYSTAVGYQALENNTGNNNTAVGDQALEANTSGTNNCALGDDALVANTTGGNNVGIGASALAANTTATHNVALGYQSLYSTTSGGDNVAIGSGALYNNTNIRNTAVGYNAMYYNTTGTSDVAVGYYALLNNTTGSENTAIGWEALRAHTTGAQNTALGRQSGYNLTTGTVNTFLGEASGYYITTGSKNVVIGRYTGNQGGLDIRTSNNNIVLSDGDGNPRLQIHSDGKHEVRQAPSGQMVVYDNTNTSYGSVGVASNVTRTSTGGTYFFFSARDNSAGTLRFYVQDDGSIKNATGSYASISDEKLKENIEDSGSQWDDIKAIRVRKFSMKEFNKDKPDMIGVIAQEVEAAGMDGLVDDVPDRDEDGVALETSTKTFKYSILYMKAIKALQEAMDRIETLETKVAALEAE